MKLPQVTFKVRELGEWVDKTTNDLFANKRVIIFSLPGAFTPTCSSKQLPGYETIYNALKDKGIDEVYCVSVNDSFVMNAWAEKENIKNVKMIPDGSGLFTLAMGMLVAKDNKGFGKRSWRYAVVADNLEIEKWFVESGKIDNSPTDPYGESAPETVMKYLQSY